MNEKILGSINECTNAFALEYLPLTINKLNKEIGSYIYGILSGDKKNITGYFFSKPFIGRHNNCILKALLHGIFGSYKKAKRLAFIHTHPKCKCHVPDQFSWGDKHVHMIAPGIKNVYLCAPADPPRILCWSVKGKKITEDVILKDFIL